MPFSEGGVSKFDTGKTTKVVSIDGEDVECEVIDLMAEYGETLKTADQYRKIGTVDAHQATEQEVVTSSQDGTKNVAEVGDWIIQNPGDKDPYVFGNKGDAIEVRQTKFAKKYEPIPDEPGKFRPKGIIRALQIDRNVVFPTSWGEEMAVKAGGWVSDGGYSIAEKSFASTYEKIENEEK